MDDLMQAARDLEHSLTEYPADWSDAHLAELSVILAKARGNVETERLHRAVLDGTS